jgi:formate-dependent nitrite reductase cytochrome c552 subunit
MSNKDKQKEAEYQRAYHKKYAVKILEAKKIRRLEQRDYLWDLKRQPCTDCGKCYDPWVMDFDHVRGEKKYELSRFARICVAWETLKEEVVKCDIVCANCHRTRTYLRGLQSGINLDSKPE